MSTMRAVRIHEFGSENVLRIEKIERPDPGRNKVLIKVMAASLNPVDWKTRKGEFPVVSEEDLPVVLGQDMAGEIVSVGDGVSGLNVGDRVFAILDKKCGGYGEYVALPPSQVVGMPPSLSFDEAAAVPLAALTAWQGLFIHGNLREGQRVLIHGGGGGVGHFAIQLAKAKGAWVAATVSGVDSGLAKELGADQIIDYQVERFEEVLEPVDMVLDLIGGETQARSLEVLKEGGVLVSTLEEPDKVEASRRKVRGVSYMVSQNAKQLAEIATLIDQGHVNVVLHKVYPFEQVAAAQRELENEHVQGKIVLRVA